MHFEYFTGGFNRMVLPKKIFKRVFQFKIYRRIIISFGLMFVMTVAILSCLLFYLFASSATKEIDNTSKQMLAQISYASDVIYDQATNISTQLANDNNIISFFNSREVDKIVYFNISRQLISSQRLEKTNKSKQLTKTSLLILQQE